MSEAFSSWKVRRYFSRQINRSSRRLELPNRRNLLNCFGRSNFTERQFRQKIQILEKHCALYLDSAIRAANMNIKKSIKVLEQILTLTDRQVFQTAPEYEIDSIIKCSLILVQSYVAHLKLTGNTLFYGSNPSYTAAKKCFHNLAYKLLPECLDQMLNGIMKFLQNEHLWKVEFICSEILLVMLKCDAYPSVVLQKMLNYVENRIEHEDVKEARHVTRVLHDIMFKEHWRKLLASDMSFLIHLYYASVQNRSTENKDFQMCRGFEICLRRLFEIIETGQLVDVIRTMVILTFNSPLTDEPMLTFGSSTEYAALCDTSRKITDLPGVIEYLLVAIASTSAVRSILACRILSRYIDQSRNYTEFSIPQIFFSDTMYNIKLAAQYPDEPSAFEVYDRDVENAVMAAIKQHSMNRVSSQAIYTLLCTITVEIPCGYIAAYITHLTMQIQKYALTLDNTKLLEMQHSNHLNAIVVSVLSLMCWVNRPKTLTKLIHTILMKRFDEGPHLNPPIKDHYQYAQHHAIWNKPDLFFSPWELRYGLWKCFRNGEERLAPIAASGMKKKMVKMLYVPIN